MKRGIVTAAVSLCAIVAVARVVTAEPLPGQQLKFSQRPMDGVVIDRIPYYGHDEASFAFRTSSGPEVPYTGRFMADDFADRSDQPIVHVRWWGSYIEGEDGIAGVQKFLIGWESDVPVGPNDPFSHPGFLLQPPEIVTRNASTTGPVPAGQFRERAVSNGGPPLNESLFEYNAELALPFDQDPDTVYWLKIVALVDVQQEGFIQWGWHNRDYTVNDPLASVAPAVVPGEHDDRLTPPVVDPLYPSEVWHFQDDAVTGNITAFITPVEPEIVQSAFAPTNYLDGIDGPGPTTAPPGHGGIGQFSKDLAFELFAVPEPGSVALAAMALAGLLVCAYRHRRV